MSAQVSDNDALPAFNTSAMARRDGGDAAHEESDHCGEDNAKRYMRASCNGYATHTDDGDDTHMDDATTRKQRGK